MKVLLVEVLESGFPGKEIKEFLEKEKGAQVTVARYEEIGKFWNAVDILVVVGSLGIAVRLVAPFLRDKRSDPGVLVVDSKGNFCIALCGGHWRGVNSLARSLAHFIGAEAVVTTASDVRGLFSPEEVASRLEGTLEGDRESLLKILSRLVRGNEVDFFFDSAFSLPAFPGYSLKEWAGNLPGQEFLFFGERILAAKGWVAIRPHTLVASVGFRKNVSAEKIEEAIRDFFKRHAYSMASLKELLTLERKKETLLPLGEKLGVPVKGVCEEELRRVEGDFSSPCAKKHLNIPGLVEPALILSGCEILVPKTVYPGITLALGRKKWRRKGLLYLVSLGAGGSSNLTVQAREALEDSEWILGYRRYLDLVPPHLERRIVRKYSAMGEEVKRAELAVSLAEKGNRVSLVSSGDVGVFGMVSPALEIALSRGVSWKIIPGVSACLYAASRLGSPLVGGFAVVSLSDYLVPWDRIKKDLELLAATDLAVAVYNLVERGKEEKIAFLKSVFVKYRGSGVAVGLVRTSGEKTVMTIEDLEASQLDMRCTLIVAPPHARVEGDTILVERGYSL